MEDAGRGTAGQPGDGERADERHRIDESGPGQGGCARDARRGGLGRLRREFDRRGRVDAHRAASLLGEADVDPCDGRVTADEVVEYVRTHVRQYARSRGTGLREVPR